MGLERKKGGGGEREVSFLSPPPPILSVVLLFVPISARSNSEKLKHAKTLATEANLLFEWVSKHLFHLFPSIGNPVKHSLSLIEKNCDPSLVHETLEFLFYIT